LLVPASGAGGVETSCVIGASSPSACRVLRRRPRAGPPAWRESSGCLAIALAERLRRRLDAGQRHDDPGRLSKHARARSESSAVAAVQVAGVDDRAWRKGSNYRTIIVDLERREVVDVLADRSAATTASWFEIPWGGG
jgi:hypothetical protein